MEVLLSDNSTTSETKIEATDKLKVILSWAGSFLYDGPLDQEIIKKIHSLVNLHVSGESCSLDQLNSFSVEFPDSYPIVVPTSLMFTITNGIGIIEVKEKIFQAKGKFSNGPTHYYGSFVHSQLDRILEIL